MMALFAALQRFNSEASGLLSAIDLIADAGAIEKIIDFVRVRRQADDHRYGDKWQIQVEIVHNTLILGDHWENQKSSILDKQEAEVMQNVACDIETNQRYWRVVTYNIGLMKWIVRSNAGRWFDESTSTNNLRASILETSSSSETNGTAVPESQEMQAGRQIRANSLIAMTTPIFINANHFYISDVATDSSKARKTLPLIPEKVPKTLREMAWLQQIDKGACPHISGDQITEYQILDLQHADWEFEHKIEIQCLIAVIRAIRKAMSSVPSEVAAECSKADLVWNVRDPDSLRLYSAECNDMDITEEVKRKLWAIAPEEPEA